MFLILECVVIIASIFTFGCILVLCVSHRTLLVLLVCARSYYLCAQVIRTCITVRIRGLATSGRVHSSHEHAHTDTTHTETCM